MNYLKNRKIRKSLVIIFIAIFFLSVLSFFSISYLQYEAEKFVLSYVKFDYGYYQIVTDKYISKGKVPSKSEVENIKNFISKEFDKYLSYAKNDSVIKHIGTFNNLIDQQVSGEMRAYDNVATYDILSIQYNITYFLVTIKASQSGIGYYGKSKVGRTYDNETTYFCKVRLVDWKWIITDVNQTI